MECTDCKYRKQIALKRCKHFELGGDKKRKVKAGCIHLKGLKAHDHSSDFALGGLFWSNLLYAAFSLVVIKTISKL